MITEICLVFIALTMLISSIVLIKIFFQMRKSLQSDLHNVFSETTQLLHSLNDFVRSHLNPIAQETENLINQLNDLSNDINDKSHSLNFLFKPFSFLTTKLENSKESTIPQILKWIGSSALLFKATKEFLKYGKQK